MRQEVVAIGSGGVVRLSGQGGAARRAILWGMVLGAVFLAHSTLCSAQAAAERNIVPEQITAGSEVVVEVTVSASQHIDGLGLKEDVPPSWVVTPLDSAGATFNPYENAWVWLQLGTGETRTVRYSLAIPQGTSPNQYTVSGFIRSLSPELDESVSGDGTVIVLDSRTLNLMSSGCCSIWVNGVEMVLPGQSTTLDFPLGTQVQLTADEPNGTCHFVGWQVNQVPVGGNPIQLTMDSDMTAVAECETDGAYELTLVSDGCCWILVNGQEEVAPGETRVLSLPAGMNVELTADEPNGTCHFVGWQVNQVPVGGNPIQLTMDSDMTAVAECETDGAYELTLVSDGCCWILVNGQEEVAPGETRVLTLPAGTNIELAAEESIGIGSCVFTGWEVNQVSVAGNPIQVSMVSDIAAVATCPEFCTLEMISDGCCSILATSGEGVTVVAPAGHGEVDLPVGTEVTLNAQDCQLDSWEINGVQQASNPFILVLNADTTAIAHCLPQVATPTMTPAPGVYPAAVDLVLACTTNGASIHYALGGAAPSPDSPLYSAPITISNSTTIQAQAYREGWSPSSILKGLFAIGFPCWEDDMEQGQDWTVSGLWHRTASKSSSGEFSQWFGDPTAGTYDIGVPVSGMLTSPEVLLPCEITFLAFRHWREVESYDSGSFDRTSVEVRFHTGTWTDWQQVWSLDSTVPSESVWRQESILLDPPADTGMVQVRFVFDTVDGASNDFLGWFIDDVGFYIDRGDVTAPAPDPMTWSTAPNGSGTTAISMTATSAIDVSGVEYYFEETSGNPGGDDSLWQESSSYTDTGLQQGVQYCYRVMARDKSPNQNETDWSGSSCATPGGDGLFEDDFSGELEAQWTLYGSPRPILVDDFGNPAPCFDNNGDSNFDSGATTNVGFDYSAGLVIEADLFVDAVYDSCWVGASYGILRDHSFGDSESAAYAVRFSYGYSGSLCNSHSEGVLGCLIVKDDGTQESHTITHHDDLLGEWHRFKIAIDPTLRVAFYVDEQLFYQTQETLSPEFNNMPVLLGHRSSSFGDAFHDNVRVTVPSPSDDGTAAIFRVGAAGDLLMDGALHSAAIVAGAADVAEWVYVSGKVEPADVLELDPMNPGAYRRTRSACSLLIGGIVSTEPAILLGSSPNRDGQTLLALAGIVPVRVTDESGPIVPGDLLVSSSTPGFAMRWSGDDSCPCSLIGKALEPMTDEQGVILVLLTAH